jgi:hypothetical protein
MLYAHPSHCSAICLSCASIPPVCDLVCARDALRRLWSGAYSKAEKYSRADVKALVEYGRERGVKIMIEFDMPGECMMWLFRVVMPSQPCTKVSGATSKWRFLTCAAAPVIPITPRLHHCRAVRCRWLTNHCLRPHFTGHAASWCTGYPEICPSMECKQPLDPSSNLTFPLITSLLSECTGADASAQLARPYTPVDKKTAKRASTRTNKLPTAHTTLSKHQEAQALFPYSLLHLGGDEVNYSCWEQDAEIVQWEADNGISGSEGTYEYFVDRVATITREQGRTPVQWVEVFEHFGRWALFKLRHGLLLLRLMNGQVGDTVDCPHR